MKFALKSLAAVAAVVAATSAHATLETALTENSSLIFLALDATGSQVATLGIDLGLNFSQIQPTFGSDPTAAGSVLQFDLANNTFTKGGVLQNAADYGSANGQFNWSNAWASFQQLAQLGESKWAVVAGDAANGTAYLTTGNPTNAEVNGATLSKSSNLVQGLGFIDAAKNLGDMNGGNVGGYVSTTGAGYVGGTTGAVIRTDGKWATGLNWNAWTNVDAAGATVTEFNLINNQPRSGAATLSQVTTYGNTPLTTVGTYSGSTQYALDANRALVGQASPDKTISTWTFDGSTGILTFTPGVPEPETYVLMALGLLGMAAVSRRRQG